MSNQDVVRCIVLIAELNVYFWAQIRNSCRHQPWTLRFCSSDAARPRASARPHARVRRPSSAPPCRHQDASPPLHAAHGRRPPPPLRAACRLYESALRAHWKAEALGYRSCDELVGTGISSMHGIKVHVMHGARIRHAGVLCTPVTRSCTALHRATGARNGHQRLGRPRGGLGSRTVWRG